MLVLDQALGLVPLLVLVLSQRWLLESAVVWVLVLLRVLQVVQVVRLVQVVLGIRRAQGVVRMARGVMRMAARGILKVQEVGAGLSGNPNAPQPPRIHNVTKL